MRIPLILLPMVLSFIGPVMVATRRIQTFLTADELEKPYDVDLQLTNAIEVNGDFTWESLKGIEREEDDEELDPIRKQLKAKEKKEKEKKEKERLKKEAKEKKKAKKGKGEVLPVSDEKKVDEEEEEDPPFKLVNLTMNVPRGSFIGIIGRVGSGKVLS